MLYITCAYPAVELVEVKLEVSRAGMTANISQLRQSVAARCKTVTNDILRNILRGENLIVSGVKAELQRRILECTILYIFIYMLWY